MSEPAVLIVEDDPQVLRVLRVALTQHGVAVLAESSGERAVEAYRRQGAAIGLVLLDVQMPGAMDGPQTLEALRAIDRDVRCCFLSGHTGRYEVEELLALGALRVFPKPPGPLSDFARALKALATPPPVTDALA